MSNLTYLEFYRREPKIARLLLLNHYLGSKSVSATAREFKTTRNTVRKALKRYKEGGEEALLNHSRRPEHFYRKTPEEIEAKVKLRRKKTNFGAARLSGRLNSEEGWNLTFHNWEHPEKERYKQTETKEILCE